jgi:peptidoglycan-N-acetylmuramic acid deacetylase
MSTLTDKEMEDNLLYLENLCLKKTGYEMKKYFRFPEGTFSERTMKNANKLGYKTFFWSLAYADWDNNIKQTDESAINNILKNTHPGAIILLHPTSDINVRILPSLIKEWKKAGYTFGSLDDLVNRNK